MVETVLRPHSSSGGALDPPNAASALNAATAIPGVSAKGTNDAEPRIPRKIRLDKLCVGLTNVRLNRTQL
jgi:hypothetical protein